MISLILPYWDRQEAANKAFDLLVKQYKDLDLEIIVVDDGNEVPFVLGDWPLNIKVIRLPKKTKPTPQSKAWNAGVKASSGEVICLSCVEILHETPVLAQMLERLEKDNYVLAAAWCPDENKWHCHTTEKVDFCPEGTGPSFLGMMTRETFDKIGGFDEDYHEGAGYEDKDFIHKALSVGVKFNICDDLVVVHPKAGAKIHWPSEGFVRNKELFLTKWNLHHSITFVCLKAGDAYGPEYVNILFDMVSRNLTYGQRGRFCCITDNPEGLHEGIEIIPLPNDLETWWGKLYMFKRGLFKEGERMIFMDLDTLIVSPIDDLIQYEGQFATLRDFYYPSQVGPAVILWKACDFTYSIWEEWVTQGKPRNPMGDLWWINNLDQGRFVKEIDILQDLFPGKFASFKSDCHPLPPKGTSVVCFHGQPKPSNCMTEWVSQVWKVGGGGFAELMAISNTDSETVRNQIKSACSRGLPYLKVRKKNDWHAVIVSGGPSVKNTLSEIKWRAEHGQTIVAVNGSAKWLNENGIVPDIQIVIDARPENLKFITESKANERFLASQCHPSLFDSSSNTVLFHMGTEGIEELVTEEGAAVIYSGTTVGLAAMAVMYALGYRNLHLHGFDSSYEDFHHAYEQPENDQDIITEVIVNGEKFKSSPWMIKQAQQFQELAQQLANDDVTITVAGSGLLPYIARLMS